MIPCLGIDPGVDGGAVLLDPSGRVALKAWAWKRVQRKGRDAWWLDYGHHGEGCTNLHAVGELIAQGVENLTGEGLGSYHLAVEGLFGHGPTLERLSWYAALVAGPLLEGAEGCVWRPLSSQWRPRVLGIPANTPADAAARLAVQRVPAIVTGLGVLGEGEHVCEAAAIARDVWVERHRRAA